MRSLALKRFITALLCLALLFRVAVPVGFMPDMSALQHGLIKIRICTGYGPQNIAVDTHDKGHAPAKSHNTICPFAGLLGSALPVLGLVLAFAFFWARLRFVQTSFGLFSASFSQAWPRGPPLMLA